MRLSISSLALLSLSSAALVVADTTKYFTEEACFTTYGSVSQRIIPTATQAFTATFILPKRTKTVTPSITSTPAALTVSTTSTSTITSYVTTQTTDIATITTTTTQTETDTETDTVTQTSTSIVTSTLPATTTTVPAPPGFTPVSSEPGYVPRALRFELPNLKARGKNGKKGNTLIRPKNGGKLSLPPALRYPQKVACKEFVEKVILGTTTKNAQPTTVTAPTIISTNTITATATTIGTSTLADATMTLTTTNSATDTTTTTTTTTVTTTTTSVLNVPSSISTTYAACSANNMIGSANGGQGFVSVTTTHGIAFTYASSGSDCCAQCQKATNCAYFYYTGGQCQINMVDTCQAGGYSGSFITKPNFQYSQGYVLGNGPCGSVRNGGSA